MDDNEFENIIDKHYQKTLQNNNFDENQFKSKQLDFKPFKDIRDEDLALLAKSDVRAQEYLLKKYKNFVRTKARTYFLTGGDKEDIVQEGMIGLYKAVRDFDKHKNSNFLAFAEMCIKRQIITAIKTSTRQKHQPLNSYVSLNLPVYDEGSEKTLMDILEGDAGACPEDIVIGKENYLSIEEKINETLSSLEKRVLAHYLSGMTYIQIAAILNISEKSVDNALHRAKSKISRIYLNNIED